jgi:hypothetical protein
MRGKDHTQAGPAEAPGPRFQEAPAVCRKLRTKLAFSALVNEDGESLGWQRGDGSTAVYWCLRTMECAGPDGALVHAAECGPDRACYQAQE